MEINKLTLSDLYSLRVVALLEDTPQSNTYYQVSFNAEQYKKFTGFLQEMFPKEVNHSCENPDCTGALIETLNEKIILPDTIQGIQYDGK